MPSLRAIVSLLCLALSCVHAEECGPGNQCVWHHLCDNGVEEDGPKVDFRALQAGNNGCPSTKVCCADGDIMEEDDEDVKTMPQGPERSQCGQVNKNGLTFSMTLASGLAQENEVPWMTALLHSNGSFLGGGSLIALDVVLTAQYKVQAFESHEIVVRAGEWDLSTNTEKFPFVEEGVRKIVLHSNFSGRNGANNIALLFLKKPLEATRHIRPICLPSRNQNFDKKRCFVSGWGKDAVNQSSFMNIMKKVDLPVVRQRRCVAKMKRLKGPSFKLHSSLMCAGGEEGKDACWGDGGSPLACPLENDPERFEQAGIVNWGVGCGTAGTPGVYTDVAKLRSWIDEQISSHSNHKSNLGEDEQKSGEESEEDEVVPDTGTTSPPPRNRTPKESPTRSPNEIDSDVLFKITTPMTFEDDNFEMKIVRDS